MRVGDPGVALKLDDILAQNQIGDLYHVCPEVALKKDDDSKCDMWALGCVMHELMTLEKPFLGANALDLLDTIKYVCQADNWHLRGHDNWYLQTLSMWMLQKKAEYRPTTLDVYSHLVRNWQNPAKAGISQIKPESVPWTSDVVMEDEGKMAFDTVSFFGMTAEERAAMPDKKDFEFVHPFTTYQKNMKARDMKAKDSSISIGA